MFSGRVLLTTVVMTCLRSEESELGWQTGGHCGKGGTALTLLPPLYFLRKKKKRNCSDFNMREFFMNNAFNTQKAKTPQRAF